MAFNPSREDYERLSLRFVLSFDERGLGQSDIAHEVASFGRRFAQDRDGLPQTDEDRAFHLVSIATTTIDYELPFADDQQAQELIERGHGLLDEALQLDPKNFDALRMKRAAEIASFEGYYDFLREREEEVRARCTEAARAAGARDAGERSALEADLAMRPCLRWLATLASKAIICGRNREALRWCEQALQLDPTDAADVRFTAAIAHAKLEDEQGLEQLIRRSRKLGAGQRHDVDDAWTQIAQTSLAYKRHDMVTAKRLLRQLIKSYPHGAATLAAMRELPDGVFSRLAVPPFSEDELILAVSEATVLFQEGRDHRGRGSLGSWVERCAREIDPADVAALDREGMGRRI
ncbi:MAG: response regulator receiver protein [Olsenella sp.]|nr:response regulator receiver protein [Olsenella sp.]